MRIVVGFYDTLLFSSEPRSQVNTADVATLVEMGFPADAATYALQTVFLTTFFSYLFFLPVYSCSKKNCWLFISCYLYNQ